ncbi:MAG: nicotinate phosphoribosyltransferase [Acetobacter indonesiensis]|jgi:nicotinate phosphoribosyltransferase|uniref:nicotinate phosphoribosyltransferase n=1 Tax=Acetobacter indonesiensis TaxID=104101 RepID=UPI000B6826CF|nr:nicotinate phosphoribosyltransferase [Acetobacter indonesiensis]MCI1436898.1 nicotinate phosphoribosyltransferase [Acetobacter indonesiensis]MCI1545979.1 nicotinate phosphoribosyltransferase [Acetobacter indonesiensis]MCI1765425.1 nicotinate phosphoribosyltransferase [Acetobacter indonesiensis]OUI96995.1 nicotinate phosphoribosyltransferase [Acetobacter indonesiensis]
MVQPFNGVETPGLSTASSSAPLSDAVITARTDSYFNRTKQIVSRFGDCEVTYAFFIRRPVISAPGLMLEWLKNVMAERNSPYTVEVAHPEGEWVGAGEPLVYITGSFTHLADLETLLLQKLGSPCVAAHRAYQIALSLPHTKFLAMDARHCAGYEMQELMAYAASVGGRAAKRDGAIGFIGTANDAVAPFFGSTHGYGTMPHALIGYAGSTVRAAEMFHDLYPDTDLVVLVDYFGKEVTDALAVCRRFPELAAQGRLAVRLDTHGGRFLEGLTTQESYAVLDRHAPDALRRYRSDSELRYLIGTGVSAAAVWRMRDMLDEGGFPHVKIIASSGFGVTKCACMADAHAPIDVVGTGSFIPDLWNETYATADIISYNGVERVKVGREFLLPSQRKTQKGSAE